MATEIKKCECKHDFQDSQYGKSMRVWNKGKEKRKCTVCGKTEKTNSIK